MVSEQKIDQDTWLNDQCYPDVIFGFFFSSPEKNVKFKHVKSTYFTCLFSVGGGLSIQEQNILPSPLYDSINIYNRHRHHHHRIHSVWAHVHSIINKKKVKMIEPENK